MCSEENVKCWQHLSMTIFFKKTEPHPHEQYNNKKIQFEQIESTSKG